MKELLRWPLALAAVVVVIRVITELAGAPSAVSNIFGVTWLYMLVPIYLAFQLDRESRPYLKLTQMTVLFVFLSRLMIAPTYSLAYLFSWSAPRFGVNAGGVVGEGVTPVQGILLTPLVNLLVGTLIGIVIAMVFGLAALSLRRKFFQPQAVDSP